MYNTGISSTSYPFTLPIYEVPALQGKFRLKQYNFSNFDLILANILPHLHLFFTNYAILKKNDHYNDLNNHCTGISKITYSPQLPICEVLGLQMQT